SILILTVPVHHFSSHLFILFLFSLSPAPRDLHSFPTRRSSDLGSRQYPRPTRLARRITGDGGNRILVLQRGGRGAVQVPREAMQDRKSTRLNSSHVAISYAVFCLKKKNKHQY